MIKTLDQFVRDNLHALMTAAAADIAHAVRPLYFTGKGGRAEHLGSCVLLIYNSRHLLLTAAHVTDAREYSAIYLPVRGKLEKLEGAGLATVAPSGNRDKDHFDFSIIELPSVLVEALGPVRFVQQHEIQSEPLQGRAYMAFGFPHSRNKKIDHGKRRIVSSRFTYGGTLFLPDQVKDDQSTNHLLRMKYEKQSRTIEGEVVNSTEPKGISGGGLFDLGRLNLLASGPIDPPKLAGLLIERRRKEKVIVATDISTVLSAL